MCCQILAPALIHAALLCWQENWQDNRVSSRGRMARRRAHGNGDGAASKCASSKAKPRALLHKDTCRQWFVVGLEDGSTVSLGAALRAHPHEVRALVAQEPSRERALVLRFATRLQRARMRASAHRLP